MANLIDVEHMQKKLEGSLAQKMVEFEERLKAATTPTNLTISQLCDEFYTFKDLVSSTLNFMQQQIQNSIQDIDAINMYNRRKALMFNGFLEIPQEDLVQRVLSLLNDKMGLLDINSSSIKQCHRLGPLNNSRPRPILVFFHDHQTKSKIWSTKAKLKGSSCSVAEFLTKIRQGVYKDARKHFGIKNVWSLDGNIYIKHPEGRAKICSQEELDTLVIKFPTASSSTNVAKATETVEVINVSHASKKVRCQQTSSGSQEDNGIRSKQLPAKK